MRTAFQLRAICSEDVEQLQKYFDITAQFDDNGSSTSSTQNAGRITLAASGSLNFPFGNVTNASLVVVVAYDEVTVQLDGSGAAIPVRPIVANTITPISSVQQVNQPGVFIIRGKVTSLVVANPSSSGPANAYVAVVGEAA